MTSETKFNEITEKLNKMFKGFSEKKQDELIKNLKNWCKLNATRGEKNKVDAIQCFLAEKNIF